MHGAPRAWQRANHVRDLTPFFVLGFGALASVAQAQVPTAQLREEIRYGSAWDEDSMLSWVLGVSLYGDSLLLVLDGMDEAI